MTESSRAPSGRRDFMKAAILGVGGLITAALGLPAVAYVIGPALKQASDLWIRLGAISKVELNSPTLFKTTVETETGWINTQEEIPAYVLTQNGQDFEVMSTSVRTWAAGYDGSPRMSGSIAPAITVCLPRMDLLSPALHRDRSTGSKARSKTVFFS
jgi:Rieske Fe-S protein